MIFYDYKFASEQGKDVKAIESCSSGRAQIEGGGGGGGGH